MVVGVSCDPLWKNLCRSNLSNVALETSNTNVARRTTGPKERRRLRAGIPVTSDNTVSTVSSRQFEHQPGRFGKVERNLVKKIDTWNLVERR